MNCAEWEERIALYAGGDEPDDAAAVERHLAECAECREFAAGLQASLEVLREAHEDALAPAHFTAVRTRVLEQLAARRVPVWRRVWIYGLAAAVLAILAVSPVWMRRELPPPPPVVALASPPAPPVHRVPARRHIAVPPRRVATAKTEPLVIQVVTDNPDVVIYWIADKRGDE